MEGMGANGSEVIRMPISGAVYDAVLEDDVERSWNR